MTPDTTRRLLAIHRITSLFVTLNVLLFAGTGAILVFRHEIDDLLGVVPEGGAGPLRTSLSESIELARAAWRAEHGTDGTPRFLFQDLEEHPGTIFVGVSDPAETDFEATETITIDRVRGVVLEAVDFGETFTGIVFHLHADLFAGPIGTLVLGAIGVAMLVALVTGAFVYGPVMRRFAFGIVRRGGARRTALADVHKLAGAATFGWLLVVTATGVLLSLGGPILQLYQQTELAAVAAPYLADRPVDDFSTVDDAIRNTLETQPGRDWSFVALPGAELASPRHYTVLASGGQGIDARMFTVTLVDARAPDVLDRRDLPLYLEALLVSEPLHFGDYAGLPLRLLWALFGVTTIVLALAGLYSAWAGGRIGFPARAPRGVRAGAPEADVDAPIEEGEVA